MVKKKNDKIRNKPAKRKRPKAKVRKGRQCEGRLSSDPTKRCQNRALHNSKFCQYHGGRNVVRSGLTCRYFVGTFGDLVKDIDIGDVDNIKDLTHELHVLRVTLTALLREAKTLEDANGVIIQYTDQISKLCKIMEQIDNGLKLTLNPRQVAALANQVVDIINQEVDDPQVRANISERVANLVIVDKN